MNCVLDKSMTHNQQRGLTPCLKCPTPGDRDVFPALNILKDFVAGFNVRK